MINKKILLVGLGLVTTTTLSGCVNTFKEPVCLYGCPESTEYYANISEETTENINKDTDRTGSETKEDIIDMDVELYGCPMSDLTKKNISEAELFSDKNAFVTIK